MKLGPRRAPTENLAFGKGRLGVLADGALVVRDDARFAEALRLPLEAPRALVCLADGSLLAAGARATLRLPPNARKPSTLPRVSLFPDSLLFGDRVSADRLWVLPGFGVTLFGYAMEAGQAGLLKMTGWVDLDAFDRRALGSLRDGSFFYTSEKGYRRFSGTGRKAPVEGEARDVWRLLPASRPDTVWVLEHSGTTSLHRIVGERLPRLQSFHLEATPYDAESSGELLAVLELAQPGDAPWSWVLEVFDVQGKRRLHVTLPADETVGPDWVQRLTRDRGLALSAEPPLVAVGGAGHLDVWNVDKGERIPTDP